ncbi:MAG: tetratricopeptide repeat protein, partial [Leptolyngbyaceae bacterium]|nr:tetratricopeptide repeat protein [Leptolyngbyaceae bacterium]
QCLAPTIAHLLPLFCHFYPMPKHSMVTNLRLASIGVLAIVALAVATEVSPFIGLVMLIPALVLCWQQFLSEESDKRKMRSAYEQGEASLETAKYEQAIEEFSRIFAMAESRLWVFGEFSSLAETFGSRGFAYQQMGDESNATADYRQANRLKPQLKTSHLYHGSLKTRKGNYQDAMQSFDRAIRFAPQSPDVYHHRGDAYFRLGEYEKARTDLSHAIALSADYSPTVYRLRGMIQLYEGEAQGALIDFVQANALKPSALQCWYLSIAQQQLGLHSERMTSLEEAIRLDPNFVFAYYGRGNIRHYTGDVDGARAAFLYAKDLEDKRVATINPTDPQGFYERGFARHHMGNTSGAIADLKKAKELCEHYRYQTFQPTVDAALAEITG